MSTIEIISLVTLCSSLSILVTNIVQAYLMWRYNHGNNKTK